MQPLSAPTNSPREYTREELNRICSKIWTDSQVGNGFEKAKRLVDEHNATLGIEKPDSKPIVNSLCDFPAVFPWKKMASLGYTPGGWIVLEPYSL